MSDNQNNLNTLINGLDLNKKEASHVEAGGSLKSTKSDNELNKPTTTNISNQQRNFAKSKCSSKSLYPHMPICYGPKAILKKVSDDYLLLIQDPLSQQLSWTKPPLYVLVIKKNCDTIFKSFIELINYLIEEHNLIVYVEEADYINDLFRLDETIKSKMTTNNKESKPSLRKFSISSSFGSYMQNQTTLEKRKVEIKNTIDKIDLIICLGGDGTILYASTLFQQSCPPVACLHFGSLGFLCPFNFKDYTDYISSILKGNVPLLLRSRLRCKFENISNQTNDSEIDNSESIVLPLEWLSLNEIVVGRGPSSYLSNLDLKVNDYLITTVQGDGLIISTPTGSTAYAMAAGASMCHPSVPSIIIAPICAHSLSFRPIVVPAGVDLKITLGDDARHNAWFSVDGRANIELKRGQQLVITTSEYPLPSICRNNQLNDWFEGLATCLHWNQRQKQLPLNPCYLESNQNSTSLSSKSSSTSSIKQLSSTTTNSSTNNANNNNQSTDSDEILFNTK